MSKRGYGISRQFIQQLATGNRRVPPDQLRKICETLELDETERRVLHVAAARDYGFEIGG